jgi:predicted Zn-dependent peptidase
VSYGDNARASTARHEDALTLRVGAAVLGRGFTSRLLSKVRDEEGLTYDIRGGLASDTFSDGEFRITASFAPEIVGARTRVNAPRTRSLAPEWESQPRSSPA